MSALGIRTARDALSVLFRHKGKMLLAFVALLGAAVAYGVLAPKTYRTEARLLIRLGRESLAVDPTAASLDRVSVSQSRTAEVQSELQILTSQDLVGQLVEDLGPEDVVGDAAATKAAAIQKVLRGMKAHVIEDSYSIEVSYEDSVPARAERVLDALIAGYMAKHAEVHRTSGSHEFFTRELSRLESDLAEKEGVLQQLRAKAGLVSESGRESPLVAQLQGIDAKIAELELEIAQLEAAEGSPEDAASVDPSLGAVVERLRDLRLQEIELLSKYPESNHFVVSMREMIAATEQMLEERRASAAVAAAARQKVLQKQRESVAGELAALGEATATLASAERELEQLRASYAKFAASAEQARIDRQLEAERISNVSVVQPAQLPLEPVAPKLSLCIAIGVLLGLFGAFAVATTAEVLDDSVRRPEDGASATGLTTVASVPLLPTAALRPPRVHKGKVSDALPNAPTESIPQLMRALAATGADRGNVIAVTGAHAGVGATSMASVLAADLARRGSGSVLLVDGNLTDADLSEDLDSAEHPGLGDALADIDAQAKVRIQRLAANRQFFLPSGTLRNGSTPVVSADRVERLLRVLKQNFDHVVVDLPPATDSTFAVSMARAADQVLLVASCGKTRQQVLRAARDALAAGGARTSGLVLNRRRFPIPRWLYRRV